MAATQSCSKIKLVNSGRVTVSWTTKDHLQITSKGPITKPTRANCPIKSKRERKRDHYLEVETIEQRNKGLNDTIPTKSKIGRNAYLEPL